MNQKPAHTLTDQAAEIERMAKAATGKPQSDLLTLTATFLRTLDTSQNPHPEQLDNSGLMSLARDYARAASPEQRDQLAAGIADKLTVDEAGVILRAAAAVRDALPRIVLRARANEDTTAEIARELGMTDSYIRRILRENVPYEWTIHLLDSEAGAGWQLWEEGSSVTAADVQASDLATTVYGTAGSRVRQHSARVTLLLGSGPSETADDDGTADRTFTMVIEPAAE
ncbi:hypothetical protein ACWCPT_05845 [Streptomyces sp. NPDC002308]